MKKFENIYKEDKIVVLKEALKGLDEVIDYISSTFEFNFASALEDKRDELRDLIWKLEEEQEWRNT